MTTETLDPPVQSLVGELRTAAEHVRAGRTPLGPGMRERAVAILDEAADKVAQYVREEDGPECPNCGEGCPGHAPMLGCDWCCNWLNAGEHSCTCYRQALMLAHVVNRLAA